MIVTASWLERVRAALAPRGYDVERELASGGMGTVFLVRHRALDSLVAIKIIRPELHTAQAAERFRQEARTLASLRHPNIVPIHDADEADGMPYYVMDYLEGETVADRLRKGRLPAALARKLGRDLLDALEAAHVHGVVHRDVKPSNVFLVNKRAVLVDFGIAKQRAASGRTPPEAEAPLTEPGAVVGTVDYMPPEQARGGEVTTRTDLYAAGMVIYEAFTGRHWFEALRNGPHRLWRRVPGGVARVLRRALEPRPEDRWPDAASFRRTLWHTRVRTYQLRTFSLTVLGLVVGAIVMKVWGPGAGAASPPPAELALVPFKAEGDADPKLGWNVPRLAALNLQAFPRVTVVDPRTSFNRWDGYGGGGDAGVASVLHALHALHLVQGRIIARADSLEVRAFVLDRRGVVVHAPVVRGARRDLERLGNRIALELVLALRPDIAERFRGSTDLRRSVQVLNLFLDGEDAFAHDDWLLAEQRYEAALQLDSTFALAQWRLSNVQRWRRMPVRVDLRRLYARQRGYLSERDRLLLAAQLAGTSAERFALYDTALARYPRDAYAALLYGDELLNRGALAGVPLDSALTVLRRAVQQDSSFAPAYDDLAWAAIRLGRRDEALAAIQSLHRLPVPRGAMDLDFTALLELTFASRFGGPDADPASAPPQMLADVARGLRFGLTFDVPEAQLTFGTALAGAPGARRELQANGHEAQGLALVALGRVREALVHFDSAAALFDLPEARLQTAQWRMLLGALGVDAVAEADRRGSAAALERWAADPRLGTRAAWALAFAAYARGDTAAGARWQALVDRRASSDSGAAHLAVLTRAARLAGRGNYADALGLTAPLLLYDSAGRGGDPFARSALHIRRAEWFERLGQGLAAEREWLWHDNADAVDWPVGVAQAGDVDWALGTYARLRRGALALGRNAKREGCPLVLRVAELWARADAALDPLRHTTDSLAGRCGR